MKHTRPTLLLGAFLLLLLAGCDAASNLETHYAPAEAPIAKMRNAHLFGQPGAGKTLERWEELMTYTEFIVGVDKKVLDLQRVLDRYEAEEGVTIKRAYSKSFKGFAAHIDKDHVERLLHLIENDADIDWMEPDPEFSQVRAGKTKNMANDQQMVSGLKKVQGQNSSAVSNDHTGSVDVDLYVIDSGVDHPDVNVVERVDFTAAGGEIDLTRVLDRYEETMDPASDAIGHGTHVAGIAAGIDDFDGLVGVAPGARVHDFKVFDGEGRAEMSSVIAALDVIRARKLLSPLKPMVVNLSLGADVGTSAYNALDEAVVAAVEAGVVVVVAAGNDGIDASSVTPAHVKEAITVGSAKPARKDKDGWLSSRFSNYGSVLDVFAPGEYIKSFSTDHGKTMEMSGTSMAAPFVAGAAALYLWQNPLASPDKVEKAIIDAARKDVDLNSNKSTKARLDVSTF